MASKFSLFTTLVVALFSLSALSNATTNPFNDGPEPMIFFCRKPPTKPADLKASFPNLFSVQIEAVYYANESKPRISDVTQSIDNKASSIVRFEDGIRYQYVFNQTTKTYAFINASSTCVDNLIYVPSFPAGAAGAAIDPILFPTNTTQGWWSNVTSIVDIWNWTTANKAEIYKDEDPMRMHEHGIPVDHYFVCKKGAQTGEVFEIEICISKPEIKMPFPGINGSLPLRIDIKRFDNSTQSDNETYLEEFVGYRLAGYRPQVDFLPPPGVPCVNASTQGRPQMPELPTIFSAGIHYTDSEDRRVDVTQLNVDLTNHYVSIECTHNDTDIPLTAHLQLPNGKHRIVHDYVYGLEYIIDVMNDKCVKVSDLPTDAADGVLNETGKARTMGLKNTSEILGILFENYTTFYYVGERQLDGMIPADVWLGFNDFTNETETSGGKSRNRTVVHEVYFSKADWKMVSDNAVASKQTLLALNTYWRIDMGVPTLKSSQRFHDLTEYKNGVPLKLMDVGPCLNVSKNDSYLLAMIQEPMETVDKYGRGVVENAMRLKLADVAKVSPLRVANFYYEYVNETSYMFFVLADRTSSNGTTTQWKQGIISALDARKQLNDTLEKGAIKVDVPTPDGKPVTVNLKEKTLRATPPMFTSPVITNIVKKEGYTGGSMAALGICMLLIGGVLGMVLAFFMWKRNRAGGGAPVYYSNKSSA